MTTATVSDKGEIAVPAELLDALHVGAGDEVEVELECDRTLRVYPKTKKPSEVCGMLGRRTSVKSTIEEMDEAVADAFRRSEL